MTFSIKECECHLTMKLFRLSNLRLWLHKAGGSFSISISRDPRPLGSGEIDGLFVPPGKAYKLLTDYLITGISRRRSEPAKEKWFSQTIHPYISY